MPGLVGLLLAMLQQGLPSVPDVVAPVAGLGIITVQVLLLHRVARVEREQEYQARVAHWENNVLQLICFRLKINIPERPTRRGG